MPVTVPRYTIEDLYSFPNDGNRYELLDGFLLVTPLPAIPHQRVLARIYGRLVSYIGPSGGAEVFSPGCVERKPSLHLEPDILVVPSDALPPEALWEVPWSSVRRSWLAVEVSGVASALYDRDSKGPAYLTLGVPEFWRLDLRDRCVYVSRSGSAPEEPHPEQVTWLAPGRAEPLVISTPDLFS